jgi:hypothetical protein
VAHTGKPDPPAFRTDAVLDFEMAGLHAHTDPESVDRENTTLADCRFAGMKELR